MSDVPPLFRQLEPPFPRFDRAAVETDLEAELGTTSALWFRCGYRPGIAAYLNFFLLRAFIEHHDAVFPSRFADMRSMARSFYVTDLFVRAVTDSGPKPSGGLSSPAVRALLGGIMARHRAVRIPGWMMSYFGFSLLENVEKQCAPLTAADQQRHLAYMTKTYRAMGVAFAADRATMEAFARDVEDRHAAPSPRLDEHARDILLIGETIGVSSRPDDVLPMLPEPTRAVFEPRARQVRPPAWKRIAARSLGRVLMRRAIGAPRPPRLMWDGVAA